MSNFVTIARPYAKAAFEHAKAHQALGQWTMLLNYQAQMLSDPRVVSFIKNPMIDAESKTAFLTQETSNMGGTETEAFVEFIRILAQRNRLLALGPIYSLYETMRENEEKLIHVKVESVAALTKAQQEQLINKLKNRLNREVSIQMSINPSLIGGARIQAGDLVIDGSVQARLNKLRANLAV